jgi:SAM-dependent methyltransferase
MSETTSSRYVMGHTDRERRRLALQGSILKPFTEQLLRRAGIAGGMHVLDVGCGVGEVSLIAARLVGPRGHVTGIDIDEGALGIAQELASEQGFSNVTFQCVRLDEYRTDGLFDAIIGRHILIHVPDPLSILQRICESLRPGGVAVFQEYDFEAVHAAYPPCPLRDQTFQVFRDFFGRACHGDIGTRLFHLFIEAGLTSPDCRAEYPIDGGADSAFYEWIAESFRSILPRAQALGVVLNFDSNPDTLAERLREEAVTVNACSPAPVMVGGFARKR